MNRGNSITDNTTGTFTIALPGNTNLGYAYTLSGETQPSLQATTVTFAGQKVDLNSGNLIGSLTPTTITPNNGNYTINVAAGTATIFEVYNGVNCNCH